MHERDTLSTMTDAAIAAFSGPGGLDAEQLGRLVDQLPVLIWSSDQDLRITSRRGGGLAVLPPPTAPDERLRVGEAVEDPPEGARVIEADDTALRGARATYDISFRARTFIAEAEALG